MMILAILQEPGSLSAGNSRLLMIFVALVAVAMVVQALVVIGAAYGAYKARQQFLAIAEQLRDKSLPILDSAQGMMNDLNPKFRTITDNLVETSHVVRSKAQDFDSTLSDVNQRARAQTERVDDMVSTVLDTTAGIASTLQKGVQIPVRGFYGVMSGIKAGLDVLVGRNGNQHHRDESDSF